jgi:FMN phosphatase YigB (HAD superfamily)
MIPPKNLLFDTIGTVFDMSKTKDEDRHAYGAHITAYSGSDADHPWQPLILPKSWRKLPVHPEVRFALQLLRSRCTIVTCSNMPLDMLLAASKHNGLSWDAIVPLEMFRKFKPTLSLYKDVLDALDFKASETMFVTANKDFGDLEAAEKWGMMPQLIRGESEMRDLQVLANRICM